MAESPVDLEHRILVHGSTSRDGAMASRVLASAGIVAHVCDDIPDLLRELNRGACAVLTVEESLQRDAMQLLACFVAGQPTWSDLPILLLTRHGVDSAALDSAIATLGNLTLLERPVRTAALISAVRSAMRARMRQYQVRESDHRKDEFLASLGHELRNPLGPIRTSMYLLKQFYPTAQNVANISAVVERQVNYLTRLVDDLLDVARITSGKVVLQRESISLADVVAQVTEICTPLLHSSGHKLDLSYPTQELRLNADPVRLIQTLSNILVNAIRYTTSPGTILFHAKVSGDTVRFSVKDPGIGLDLASADGIFDMFNQGKTPAGQVQGGLGIGLSLARRFAEMHGGTIEVHSDGLGCGSEFIVTLPIVIGADEADADVGPPAQAIAQPPLRGNAMRVLIVDDNRDGADMLLYLFQAAGFEAEVAYDGQQGVDKAAARPPDVVLMDIGMPGMDGYEAAFMIRQQPGCETTLMIAVTGWGQETAQRLALQAGFDHHMTKPIDFEVLRELLAQVV